MVPVRDLFEGHLTVVDLQRSMTFFGQTLGLELAEVFWDRRAAFYWIGGRGNSMLGLWEVGTSPQRLSLHVAFRVDLRDLLDAPAHFRAASVVPLDFWGQPTEEPVVLAWMPAASDGEVRRLGIPTVLDRFTQQAVMQVLQRRWDGPSS